MVENLDYEMLNTIMKATAEMLKYNATLETAQKTLYAAFFTAGASIFAAGITIFGNYRINIKAKKIDYQNEYYKKILDKRINAYEALNNLVFNLNKFSSINIRINNSDTVKKDYPVIFANMSSLEELIRRIGEFHKEEFWISYSTVGIIHRYIYLLSSAVTDIRKNNNDNSNLQFVALERYTNEFQNGALGKHITDDMFNDLIGNIRSNLALLENTELSREDYNFYSLAVGMALNEIIKLINNALIEKYMDDFKELHKIDDFLDFNQQRR